MKDPMAFLLWVKGPAFDMALAVFIIGILLRILEIFLPGRAPNFAEPRGGEWGPGFRTIFSRSVADSGTFQRAAFNVIVGYIWHLGFLVALLLFVPHIAVFSSLSGMSWPGLPNPVVDGVTVITLGALLAMLLHRLRHPVMRFLSTFEDYLTWAVVFAVVFSGYLAYHRMIDPYPLALGIHLLMVEGLLILFPFTKLMHAITFLFSRWYTGAIAGRKGVES